MRPAGPAAAAAAGRGQGSRHTASDCNQTLTAAQESPHIGMFRVRLLVCTQCHRDWVIVMGTVKLAPGTIDAASARCDCSRVIVTVPAAAADMAD